MKNTHLYFINNATYSCKVGSGLEDDRTRCKGHVLVFVDPSAWNCEKQGNEISIEKLIYILALVIVFWEKYLRPLAFSNWRTTINSSIPPRDPSVLKASNKQFNFNYESWLITKRQTPAPDYWLTGFGVRAALNQVVNVCLWYGFTLPWWNLT